MDRFVLRYGVISGILFVLLYFPTNAVSAWLNLKQVQLTLHGLDLFLEPGIRKGIDLWINPHYKIYISQACNGMVPILLLWGGILAYPSSWIRKGVWMILGYLAFSVANVIRLVFVVYVTRNGEGQADFFWSHDIVGNVWMGGVGIALFLMFVRSASRSS